jgi:FtsZ-binding cell division protein ZapB
MDTRPKANVLERLENAIKQRTCIWESDIKLAIDEITELRNQVQELKDKNHLKKLNKVKEVE